MQIGSGTYDMLLKTTYTKYVDINIFGYNHSLSLGGQLSSVLRTGKNSNGYRLGNTLTVTAWVSRLITEYISVSGRITRYSQSDIEGTDSDLMVNMSPSNSTNTGLINYKVSGGLNFKLNDRFKGVRAAVEVSMPLYQNVNNIQLGTDSIVTIGIQHLF